MSAIVTLKKGEGRTIKAGGMWVFDNEIDTVTGTFENGEVVLGDIIISLERAREQAEEYGHSLKREIAFLTAHSMLHLLGYDHMEPEEEKEMFAKQKEILELAGIPRA